MLEVSFKYNGKPVRSIDYTYFDGKDWSELYSAKDGVGVIELSRGSDISKLQIKYEYLYSGMSHINREVSEVEKAINDVVYTNSNTRMKGEAAVRERKKIPPVGNEQIKQKVLDVLAKSRVLDSTQTVNNAVEAVSDADQYRRAVLEVCRSISYDNYEVSDTLFTADGYDVYRRLIEYGNAKVLDFDELTLYKLGNEVYCRSVPMVFSFANNGKKFVEKVVFTFDASTKISNITFALSESAAADIVSKKTWGEEARIIIVSFLENYKTSYALKRLDYIKSIFDEDALIITGRVVYSSGKGEFAKNRYVQLTRQSKEQYIRNLARCFASNEFINIHFADNDVIKMGKGGEMYGIQIRQDYYSSNYADSGYLFLMVDLNDYSKPIIHVRTWQEEPDKDFGIIGPYHF